MVAETQHNSTSSSTIDGDRIARRYLLVGSAFGVAAGFLIVLQFTKGAFPAFLDGLGVWTYGRVRPMATSITIFGWLTPMLIGAAYYLVPRLTGTALRFARLAGGGIWFHIAVVLVGTSAIGAGLGDGFEMFEFPAWADALLFASLTIPALVITATLRKRNNDSPGAPLLFLTAAVIWLPITVGLVNLTGLNPVGFSVLSAFTTAAIHHLWVIGASIGLLLYLVPNLTDGSLHSEKLARIAFWSLALAGGASGYSRFTHGPGPDWLETAAIVWNLILVLVAIATFINATDSMRGRWHMIQRSVPLRFALAAALLLPVPIAMATIGGFRSVAAIVGLTSWWEGTSFFLLFGIGGWTTAAFTYAVLPRLLGRNLYQTKLAQRHLLLSLIGVTATSAFLWLSGLVAGFTWAGGTYSGSYVNTGEGFFQTIFATSTLRIFALVGVLITFAGHLVHGYLVYRTVTSGTTIAREVPTVTGAANE